MSKKPVQASMAGEGPKTSAPTKAKNAGKFFLAIALILLAIIALMWYQGHQRQQAIEENTYNGFRFQQTQSGLWVTRIEVGVQPYDIPFYYHPREVLDVEVDIDATRPILEERPKRIFISLDPDAGSRPVIAGVEISRITGHKYELLKIPTQSALSRPADRAVEVPIVSCNNIPANSTVIQFIQHEEKNLIVASESCVYLFYVTPEDSIRVADRYAYELLKIM